MNGETSSVGSVHDSSILSSVVYSLSIQQCILIEAIYLNNLFIYKMFLNWLSPRKSTYNVAEDSFHILLLIITIKIYFTRMNLQD